VAEHKTGATPYIHRLPAFGRYTMLKLAKRHVILLRFGWLTLTFLIYYRV